MRSSLLWASTLMLGCGAATHGAARDDLATFPAALGAILHEPELGKGVDASESRTFSTCVMFAPCRSESATFGGRLYDEFAFSTRAELNRKLGVSAEVAARGLWGSASARASHFRDVEIDDSSFYWAVVARYELLHESIATHSPDFRLTPRAARILSDHGWEAFTKACGTHFYSGRRLGAQYALLYEFTDRGDRSNASLSASASASAFGIGASTAFDASIHLASQRRALKIHSDMTGGDAQVAEVPRSAEELRRELTALRRAVGEGRHGVPVAWETLPYDVFAEVVAARRMDAHRDLAEVAVDDALAFMYTKFMENRERQTRMKNKLDASCREDPYFIYSAAQRDAIEGLRSQLVAQNIEIAARARRCISQPGPESCAYHMFRDIEEPPEPEKDFSDLGSRDVTLIPTHNLSREVSPSLNFLVTSPASRIYLTQSKIYQGPDDLLYAFAGPTQAFLPIGRLDPVETADGYRQPELCQKEFRRRCNLRIVERHGTARDGAANDELILEMYGDDGSLLTKNVFRPTLF